MEVLVQSGVVHLHLRSLVSIFTRFVRMSTSQVELSLLCPLLAEECWEAATLVHALLLIPRYILGGQNINENVARRRYQLPLIGKNQTRKMTC